MRWTREESGLRNRSMSASMRRICFDINLSFSRSWPILQPTRGHPRISHTHINSSLASPTVRFIKNHPFYVHESASSYQANLQESSSLQASTKPAFRSEELCEIKGSQKRRRYQWQKVRAAREVGKRREQKIGSTPQRRLFASSYSLYTRMSFRFVLRFFIFLSLTLHTSRTCPLPPSLPEIHTFGAPFSILGTRNKKRKIGDPTQE